MNAARVDGAASCRTSPVCVLYHSHAPEPSRAEYQVGRITPWTDEHTLTSRRYKIGQRLVNAAKALSKVAANGWATGYMPTDVEQANALADAIEKYVAAHPKSDDARRS